MRVNVYAEEMTDRVEIVKKVIDGVTFTGVRFYLYLPVTTRDGVEYRGPFIHRSGDNHIPHDDDSAAITFWGKKELRGLLLKAMDVLDHHYGERFDSKSE